jgi:hypothetical protein
MPTTLKMKTLSGLPSTYMSAVMARLLIQTYVPAVKV